MKARDARKQEQRGNLTRLLVDWSEGDGQAFDQLASLVYKELRGRADRYMRREREDHTFQPTDLVHEAFLELMKQNRVRWQDRDHFFRVSSMVMHRILLQHARKRRTAKRGGGAPKVPFDETCFVVSDERAAELIAVHEALEVFFAIDERRARVVELRFFGGRSYREIAEIYHVSERTAKRWWESARGWLNAYMQRRQEGSET